MTRPDLYRLLADAVLLVHFAFVVFVVSGLLLIWVGRARGWRWVRHGGFRAAHLIAIGIVVAESLGGMVCPLTTWEAELRVVAGENQRYAGSFVQYWVHRAMFFEASERTFTIIYVGFFLLVLASLVFVRPRWPWTNRAGTINPQGPG